ncbi:mitochondrial glycerol-3-phosphate dehydrogenase, partial [Linnemannia exigua]
MWRRIPATGARHSTSFRTKAAYATAGATTLALSGYYYNLKQQQRALDDSFEYPPQSSMIYLEPQQAARDPTRPHAFWAPPSREDMLRMLQEGPGVLIKEKHAAAAAAAAAAANGSTTPSESNPSTTAPAAPATEDSDVFDLLIIGGGATGAGCAVDAATRGLKVAMVERDDFSSGTSSRSTKLVHGGVRYLEKAVRELDIEQYKLVKEALNERANFLKVAPYLSYQLPIMLPIYKWWQVPYYWAGSKAYDLLAGHQGMESSYFLSRGKALEAFPMLKNDKLVGAMVYYDGQHNDSRMNVALGLTAVQYGAVIANHVEVIELHKDNDKRLCGARVRDTMTGKDPGNMGLLDPATSDGRVIFFLPWQGNTIAGTTDSATDVTPNPMATEEEINWILGEVKNYLNPDVKVRHEEVLAAWSGIRPLVRDPAAKSTEGLVRNHMINVSASGLLTITGGKWTTYRAMATETIDEAIKVFGLNPTSGCSIERVKLIGPHGYSHT